MKKFIFTIALASFGAIGAQAQIPVSEVRAVEKADVNDKKAPRFKFKDGDMHDFGTLPEGPEAEYVFKFRNTGKKALIINSAHASCGCTIPSWPKEPIAPGKYGELKVTFHTTGKGGQAFDKIVYINSNAATEKREYELHIKGKVEMPAFDPTKG